MVVAGAVVGAALLVAGASLGLGIDPSFPVVLTSAFVLPAGYVIGTTVVTNPEGRTGVLGPFVLVSGVLLGAVLERQLGIDGLEGYLTPTLLVNYPTLLALTRSLRVGLARRLVGWDSSARSRLVAQGQTPAAI